MARVSTYLGSFAKRTGTGTQTVSGIVDSDGVPFRPKACIFWSVLKTAADGMEAAAQRQQFGFSDGATHTAMSHASQVSGLDTAWGHRDDAAVIIVDLDETLNSSGYVDSFSSGFFVFNWTTAAGHANVLINFLAIGGSQVRAAVGDVASRTSTGQQSVTGLGFQPDVVLFLACVVAGNFAGNGFGPNGVGWMTASQQGASSNDTAVGPGRLRRYQRTDRCLVAHGYGGFSYEAEAVSLDADGFTINWLTARAGQLPYLALKGVGVEIGAITAPAATGTSTITTTAGYPKALILMSNGNVASTVDDDTDQEFSFGACDRRGTQIATWSADRDAAGTTARFHSTTCTLVTGNRPASAVTTEESRAAAALTDTGVDLTWTITNADLAQILYLVLTDVFTQNEPSFFSDGEATTPLTEILLTDRDEAVHGFAEVDLNDADDYEQGYKPGWVVRFERISRGLSDRAGQLEHLAFGAVLSDTTRFFRGLLDGLTTKYFTNRPLVEKMIDDDERRDERPWRIVANGFVSDYSPRPLLQFLLRGSDWLKKQFTRKRHAQERWQPLIPVADFPDCPLDTIDIAAPIWYGRLSDVAAGAVLSAPTGLTGAVVGAAGSIARQYGVSAMRENRDDPTDHNGETDPAFVDVASCPDDDEVSATRYMHLEWSAVTDAAAYRVYGRRPDGRLQLIATVTDLSFNDGNGPTGFLPLLASTPLTFNGTSTGDTGRGVIPVIQVGTDLVIGAVPMKTYLIARGVMSEIEGIYLDGVRLPDSRFTTSDVLSADFPNWPEAQRYITRNSHRYTVFYANSQIADADATARWSVNLKGYDTIGDGTGTLIVSIPQITKHLVTNFLSPSGCPDGDWRTAPEQFAAIPDLTLLEESTFDDVDTEAEARVSGGYQGAGGFGAGGQFLSALDALAQLHVSGDFEGYFNRKGQYAITMEPRAPEAGTTALDDVISIVDGTFEITDEVNTGFFNVHPYAHTKDYTGRTTEGWGTVGLERDETSITLYDQEREAPRWEFHFLRNDTDAHLATVADVIDRKLARYSDPRRRVSFAVPFSGLNYELGDVVPITHIEGIGGSGWTDHDVRIVRHEIEPTEGRVFLEAYDMEIVYASGFILGDRATLPAAWENAGSDERRYGYLADRTTGLFSTGDAGKELR